MAMKDSPSTHRQTAKKRASFFASLFWVQALLVHLPANAQVLPWPGEELMTYGLAYQAAITNDRLLSQPWVVFTIREGMQTFDEPACINARSENVQFLQPFYVHELNLEEESVHLVEAEIGRQGLLKDAVITKDWGWAKMDDLLLSSRAFRDPDNFVPQRALVKTEMTAQGIAEVPRLYSSPSKNSTPLKELEYTSFFYVYKAWPAETGQYDPLWGYKWYFVTSEPFLNVASASQSGSSISPVARGGFAGWLQGGHTLIWNTREALEPVIGRTRQANVFTDSKGALDYSNDSSLTGKAALLDQTPLNEGWIGQRFRYPVLGQDEKRSSAQAQLVAYQGKVRFSQSSDAVPDYGIYETALFTALDLEPKIIFVFDGTVSMCDLIVDTIKAAEEIVQEVRKKGIEIEVGAVVYKDRFEGFKETQTFPLKRDINLLLTEVGNVGCAQPGGDNDFEESVFTGIHTAWDQVLGRAENAHAIYILMGDAGSSSKEAYSSEQVASALSGLDSGGDGKWNMFSLHAFHIEHFGRSDEERVAIAQFNTDIRGALLGTLAKRENPYREPGRESPHSYQTVDVRNPGARRIAVQQAADKIEAAIRTVESIRSGTEETLTTGAPLSFDDPIATSMMETFLRTRLGEEGFQVAREQRTQIFYQGWSAMNSVDGRPAMAPVLFLTRRETSELLDMVERMREFRDCAALMEYVADLIGKVSPDDERLPISLLIEKRKGFRFRSKLLDTPYDQIQNLCSVNASADFNDLLRSFEEIDQYLYTIYNDEPANLAESRKYRLLSGDYYWVPMDKLP